MRSARSRQRVGVRVGDRAADDAEDLVALRRAEARRAASRPGRRSRLSARGAARLKRESARDARAGVYSVRVAFTLEQCWHRVPGGTAVAALELARALRSRPGLELIGVAARHRDPPPEQWRPPIAVAPPRTTSNRPLRVVALPPPAARRAGDRARRRDPCDGRRHAASDEAHRADRARPRVPRLPGALHAPGPPLLPPGTRARATGCVARALLVARDARRDAARRASRRIPAPPRATRSPRHPRPTGGRRAGARGVCASGAVHPLDRHGRAAEEPRRAAPCLLPARDGRRARARRSAWLERGPRAQLVSGLPRRHANGSASLGWVPRDDLEALYAAATVMCFPSLLEGFGFPVVEAMAQGTPVVTSRGTSTEELVSDDAGLLVDPREPKEIAAALTRVLTDDGACRTAFGCRARACRRVHVGAHRRARSGCVRGGARALTRARAHLAT